jgi:hypothetical protein
MTRRLTGVSSCDRAVPPDFRLLEPVTKGTERGLLMRGRCAFIFWIALAVLVHLALGSLAFRLTGGRPEIALRRATVDEAFDVDPLEPPAAEWAPPVQEAVPALSERHATTLGVGARSAPHLPGMEGRLSETSHTAPPAGTASTGFDFDRIEEGGANRAGPRIPGLNAGGEPGEMSLNLTQADIPVIVGEGELRREAADDAERRAAEHRASWAGLDFAPWRAAIESYVPTVRLGNQRALGDSHAAFVAYLTRMAARIAPIFGTFVHWIGSLPASHPLRRTHLSTRLEIVLNRADGRIMRMGVVLGSGVTAFEVGALRSVNAASPFGAAPESIASADDRVYIQWDLHNDEYSACTPENARPAIVQMDRVPEPTFRAR